MTTFTISEVLSEGWQTMTRNYWPLLGASVVYFLIVAVVGAIPIVSLANLIITGPLMAGLFFMGVKAMHGPVVFGDLWSGFSRFGSTLGIYWLQFLVAIGAMIPFGVCAGIAIVVDERLEGPGIALMVVGGLVSLAACVVIAVRFGALLSGLHAGGAGRGGLHKA